MSGPRLTEARMQAPRRWPRRCQESRGCMASRLLRSSGSGGAVGVAMASVRSLKIVGVPDLLVRSRWLREQALPECSRPSTGTGLWGKTLWGDAGEETPGDTPIGAGSPSGLPRARACPPRGTGSCWDLVLPVRRAVETSSTEPPFRAFLLGRESLLLKPSTVVRARRWRVHWRRVRPRADEGRRSATLDRAFPTRDASRFDR